MQQQSKRPVEPAFLLGRTVPAQTLRRRGTTLNWALALAPAGVTLICCAAISIRETLNKSTDLKASALKTNDDTKHICSGRI